MGLEFLLHAPPSHHAGDVRTRAGVGGKDVGQRNLNAAASPGLLCKTQGTASVAVLTVLHERIRVPEHGEYYTAKKKRTRSPSRIKVKTSLEQSVTFFKYDAK